MTAPPHRLSESAAISAADRLIGIGQALEDEGDFEAALACYRDAIQAAPNYAPAHMNAGNALGKLNRWDEGLEEQRRAVQCAPRHAPAHFNLGAFLFNRGALVDAAAELARASQLAPDMMEAPLLLADVYELQQRVSDAEAQYKHALSIAPHHTGLMLNFGWFCVRQGRMEDALQWLGRARNDSLEASDADGQMLFAMNFCDAMSPGEIAREHLRMGGRLSRSVGAPFTTWPNDVDESRRLRVAYVSGDFGPHPVAFFVRTVLRHHDRSRFEIFGYSNSAQSDPIELTVRAHSDHWRSIAAMDDAAVVDQIRRDGIDILVDLSGHTNRGRLRVFARHPAPVQTTWLGYLNTTGMVEMDYRITDAHTDPEGTSEHLHSERLIRLPHSQWCYSPPEYSAPVSRPHGERRAAIVYGSFNQVAKISDTCLVLWSRILQNIPQAELVAFDVRHADAGERLLARMKAHGIDGSRVTLHGRVPLHEYFAAIGDVDIALDTIPYNGATTALDVLWMGVPVVGVAGDRGISRGTYSILRTLGADDLIAVSSDEYVAINVRLAHDAAWRGRLRETLRPRLAASPLMDVEGFTRNLETCYQRMWRAWCASQNAGV